VQVDRRRSASICTVLLVLSQEVVANSDRSTARLCTSPNRDRTMT